MRHRFVCLKCKRFDVYFDSQGRPRCEQCGKIENWCVCAPVKTYDDAKAWDHYNDPENLRPAGPGRRRK